MTRNQHRLPAGPLNFENVARLAGWDKFLERFRSETLEPGCAYDDDGFALLHPEPPQRRLSLHQMAESCAENLHLFAVDRRRNLALWQDELGADPERWVYLPWGNWIGPPEPLCPEGHSPIWEGTALDGASAAKFDLRSEQYAWELIEADRGGQSQPLLLVSGIELKRCVERCGWIKVGGQWMASPEAVVRYLEHSELPDLAPQDLPPFD